MRLTEEEVYWRISEAEDHSPVTGLRSREVAALCRAEEGYIAERPMHRYPAALRIVGVRWTGEHYEEVSDG